MIDDDVALFGGDPNKACRAYSDPLFLTDYFMEAGHTAAVHNGTVTFVRRHGQVYACTCRHVMDAVHQSGVVTGSHPTAALMYGRVRQNLSFWTVEGLRLGSRSPEGVGSDYQADVAIVWLGHTWDLLIKHKPKVAIDLDKWEPPPWNEVHMCCAAGYQDEHKSSDGRTVSSPMPLFHVKLASEITSGTREFTLNSTLAAPHGSYLSGMSGGPILAAWRDRFTPIGLIFEGEPSSAASSSLWAGPNDVLIRGLLLTPERFDTWLSALPH